MRRLTNLLIKIMLKPYQMQSVRYFKKYMARESENDIPDPFETPEPETAVAQQLWEDLDLDGSSIDRLILHAITRRQVDGFEPDPNQSDTSITEPVIEPEPDIGDFSINQVDPEEANEVKLNLLQKY